MADFTKAVTLDAKYANAYFNRGITYSLRDEYERAIDDFKRVLRINPKNTAAYNAMADIFAKTGRKEEAGKVYQEIIRQAQEAATTVEEVDGVTIIKHSIEWK